jgi:hypothetical protein
VNRHKPLGLTKDEASCDGVPTTLDNAKGICQLGSELCSQSYCQGAWEYVHSGGQDATAGCDAEKCTAICKLQARDGARDYVQSCEFVEEDTTDQTMNTSTNGSIDAQRTKRFESCMGKFCKDAWDSDDETQWMDCYLDLCDRVCQKKRFGWRDRGYHHRLRGRCRGYHRRRGLRLGHSVEAGRSCEQTGSDLIHPAYIEEFRLSDRLEVFGSITHALIESGD